MANVPVDQNTTLPDLPAIEVPEADVAPEELQRRIQLAESIKAQEAIQAAPPPPVLDQAAINPLPAVAQAVGIQPVAKVIDKAIDLEATKQAEQDLKLQKQVAQDELKAEIAHKQKLEAQRRAQELAADAEANQVRSRELAAVKSQEEFKQKALEVDRQSEEKVQEYIPKTAGELLRDGNFAQKLGAAFGMLLGGYAGGLTGKFNNPFIETLNKAVDQYVEKKRLGITEAAAVREAAYKAQEAQIKQMAAKSGVVKDNLQIQKLQQDLQAGAAQMRQEANLERLLASGQITDPSLLDDKRSERAVRLPDGTYRLALNKNRAEALNKYRDEVEPAIEGAKRIMDFAKTASQLSLSDRAKIGVELQALVGQLRLPFVGPGALTDKEYERIQSTLGDPKKVFALKDVELVKLSTVLNKLQKDLAGYYRRANIDLPKTNREQLLEKYSQKFGIDQEKADALLKKLGK